MRMATFAIVPLFCFAAAAQGNDAAEKETRVSAAVGVMTFHGDGIKSEAKTSFELRAEHDVSENVYVYLGWIYGEAVVEEERYGVVPLVLPRRFGLGIFPLIFPRPPVDPIPQVPPPPIVLPIPFLIPHPRPVLPLPFRYDAGEEDKDVHIITAGPGYQCEPWERWSFRWDIGAGVVFGEDVDSHLALNTSLGAAWQMTDRAALDLGVTGSLLNTEIDDADLDWGWGAHLGVSIALGSNK